MTEYYERELISKNSTVENIIDSCEGVYKAGDIIQSLLAQLAIYISPNEELINDEEFQEYINKISSGKIKEISDEINGIVLNADGTLDIAESIKQVQAGNIEVQNHEVRDAIKQEERVEFVKKFIMDNFEDLDKIQFGDIANINKLLIHDLNIFSEDKDFFEALSNADFIEVNKYINDNTNDYKSIDIFDKSIIKSWINGPEELHEMRAINLAIEAEKNNPKAQKMLKDYLDKHPECKNIFDKNGKLSNDAIQKHEEFSENLLKAKIIEYNRRDSENNVNFNDLSNEEKLGYLKNTLIGLYTDEPEIRKMSIARLKIISPDLIKDNLENGKITLDEEKFLNFYNSFSNKKNEKDVQKLYVKSIKYEKSKFISEKLAFIEKHEHEMIQVDISDESKALKQIKSHLGIKDFDKENYYSRAEKNTAYNGVLQYLDKDLSYKGNDTKKKEEIEINQLSFLKEYKEVSDPDLKEYMETILLSSKGRELFGRIIDGNKIHQDKLISDIKDRQKRLEEKGYDESRNSEGQEKNKSRTDNVIKNEEVDRYFDEYSKEISFDESYLSFIENKQIGNKNPINETKTNSFTSRVSDFITSIKNRMNKLKTLGDGSEKGKVDSKSTIGKITDKIKSFFDKTKNYKEEPNIEKNLNDDSSNISNPWYVPVDKRIDNSNINIQMKNSLAKTVEENINSKNMEDDERDI